MGADLFQVVEEVDYCIRLRMVVAEGVAKFATGDWPSSGSPAEMISEWPAIRPVTPEL